MMLQFGNSKIANGYVYLMLSLAILGLILIKLSNLHLPFYWDEAWSYAKAVYEMYTHKITLLPSEVNQEIFRGHPLFFYFLTSGFAKLTSFTPLAMHACMLGLSMVLLIALFFILKKHHGISIAFIATAFLLFQEVFIVQSSFLLPEVLIAFLGIFCFYAYVQKNYLLYILCGAMLVLTKESGIVAILVVCLYELIQFLYHKKLNLKGIAFLFFWSLPLWIFGLFILIQKLKWGWYLFPEHVSMMDLSIAGIKNRLHAIATYLFFSEGRNVYTFLFFACILLIAIFKWKLFKQIVSMPVVHLLLVFFIFYSLFSSVNFYSARYLLALLPVIAILSAIIIDQLFSNQKISFFFSILLAVFFLSQYFLIQTAGLGDTSKHYVHSVSSLKLTIDEFVIKNTRSSFGGDFLTNTNLQFPEAGYISSKMKLHVVSPDDAQYIIATSIEPLEEKIKELKQQNKIEMVYENVSGPAWCRVYYRK
ncbi:MAG: hypothetical protein IPI46_07485 [Bacteroidetes bacterium]|nr:hypothetical protein [Bacteroidota bacterium]